MAFNELDTLAKRQARQSGIGEDARKFLENKLQEIANAVGMKITFVCPEPASGPAESVVVTGAD